MKTPFKKTTLILAGMLSIAIAHATVITVTVQNFSFTPSSFTATVGDTVKWVWSAGNHTTTSTSVPSGAASWNNPMNSSSTTFEYVITTPGTYNYWCAIHTTMMEAGFTVNPAGIPVISNSSKVVATIYPNPATSILNIKLLITPVNNELSITDLSGREVARKTLTNVDNSIDVSTWKKGFYIYHLKCNSEDLEGKFEVQ
ncbi:MAG: T9SS type A sorting domain-containing protein [Bacteroidia bacterium]